MTIYGKQKGLIYGMLLIIFVSGAYFRIAGFDTHVTYIDELIILTEGEWNSQGREESYVRESPIQFSKSLLLNQGVTYAPLQFLATYFFVKPYKPLSKAALSGSRIPSVIFGCLSIILLLLIFYSLTNGRSAFSYLLPASLLATSQINIVNSQQNHTYIIGVFGFLVLTLACTWLYKARRASIWVGASVVISIITFANYQLVPVVALGILITGIAIIVSLGFRRGLWEVAVAKCLVLASPSIIVIGFTLWILANKSSASIPWWVKSFGVDLSSNGGCMASSTAVLKNAYYVFESLLWMGKSLAFNHLAMLAVGLVMCGGITSLAYNRFRTSLNVIPLLLSLATFCLFIFLYLSGRIALSPSRHTLMLSAPLMIFAFYCSVFVERSGWLREPGLKVYRAGLLALSITFLLGAHIQHSDLRQERVETFSAEAVIDMVMQEDIDLIVTDWWSYNKAYLILQEHIKNGLIELRSAGEEKDFPDASFLLIGQNTETFAGVYSDKFYKRYSSRLLLEKNSGYDFEPSEKIKYWPNRMAIYRVDRNY